jgi:hypothetical protein
MLAIPLNTPHNELLTRVMDCRIYQPVANKREAHDNLSHVADRELRILSL